MVLEESPPLCVIAFWRVWGWRCGAKENQSRHLLGRQVAGTVQGGVVWLRLHGAPKQFTVPPEIRPTGDTGVPTDGGLAWVKPDGSVATPKDNLWGVISYPLF